MGTLARDRLIAALEQARRDQHVSIRAAARLAGVPTATVQGWLNGRHYPTPALRPQFLLLVRGLGLDHLVTPEVWESDDRAKPSPYLGLRPYGPADWELFAGRDEESQRLAAEVRERAGTSARVLAVLGVSGSGKSSLVAAGVAGQQTRPGGVLDGWGVRFVTVPELDGLAPQSEHELWILDQFDDQIRRHLVDGLAPLASVPEGVVVLVVLRADAFGEAARFAELREPLSRPFIVRQVTEDDVRRIVSAPAQRVGVLIDPQLIDLVIRDAGITRDDVPAGILPLISNALAAGWMHSSGDIFRASDYLACGGLSHSIDELAEGAYRQLGEEAAPAVKELFVGMVTLDGDASVRRPLPLDGLSDLHRRAADSFAAARLLTISDTEVWISHDALLSQWPRLRDWIDEDRSRLRALERLAQAAGTWQEQGRPAGLLLPVTQLPVFQAVVDDSQESLMSPTIREYIAASEQHFASVVQRERVVNHRLRRRARVVTALAALTTVLAIVAGYQVVRTQRIQADAQSRQVATAAVGLRVVDPSVRAQMATVASVISPTREGNSAVLDAVAADTPTRWTGPANSVAATTDDGQYVVRANSVGEVTWWSAASVRTSPGTTYVADKSRSPIYSVAATVIGGRVLIATAGVCRTVWDVTDEPREVYGVCPEDTTYGVAFSHDGSVLVFGSEQTATWMAVDAGNVSTLYERVTPARAVAVATSGDVFLGGSGPITRWRRSGRTYTQVSTLPEEQTRTGRVQALAVSPDGRWLAAGIAQAEVRLWDLSRGDSELPPITDVTSYVNGVAFTADGSRLAIADSDQKAYVVGTADWSIQRILSDPAQVTSVAWTASGQLVSSSVDGSLRVWDARSPILRRSGTPLWQLAADATGTKWLATSSAGTVMLWRGPDRIPVVSPTVPAGVKPGSAVTINAQGTELVVGTKSGAVVSWPLGDAVAGEPRVSALADGGSFGAIAISPDGTTLVATRYLGKTSVVAQRSADGAWVPVATITTPTPQTGAFTADGTVYCVGSAEGYLMVFDVSAPAGPRLLTTLTTDAAPTAVTTSGQGRYVVAGTDLGSVYEWDLADPAQPSLVRTFHDALSPINGVSFSPDGKRLAAASGEGFLWLWELGTDSTARYSLSGGLGSALDVRFFADGEVLLGAGDTGQLRAWPTSPEAARSTLCAKQGTPLTDDEWVRYMPGVTRRAFC